MVFKIVRWLLIVRDKLQKRIKYETKLAKACSTITKTYRRNQQTLANTWGKIVITEQRIETTSKHPPKH